MNALNSEFIMYRRQELGIYLQKLLRMDYIRHSELIAKFLSPSCDDFNKIAFISMPKQAIGSAGEFAGLVIFVFYYHTLSQVFILFCQVSFFWNRVTLQSS